MSRENPLEDVDGNARRSAAAGEHIEAERHIGDDAAERDRDDNANATEVGAVLGRGVSVIADSAGLGGGLVTTTRAASGTGKDGCGRANGGEGTGDDGFGKHFDCLVWEKGNLNDGLAGSARL